MSTQEAKRRTRYWMTAEAPPTDDPVRAVLLQRARELKWTLSALSIECGHGPRYLSKYVKDGVPQALAPQDRITLARALKVPEFQLCAPGQYPIVGAIEAGAEVETLGKPGSIADVPLFHENQAIDPQEAREWAPRPSNVPFIGGMIALQVERGCTRTRPGDTVYAINRRPRTGDIVVCIRDQHVTAVGELVHIDDDVARVNLGSGGLRDIPLDGAKLLKVVTVVTA